MKSTGSSDRAMAPTTILVLKRAPSCSLLRSAHRRSTVRVRIKRKTSSAAVMKVETVYNAMASRQLLGSKGTSSEPNVNTAESSSVRSAAPIPSVQRCFGSSELIEKPESRAAEKSAAGIHCSEDCVCGNTPCRCERSRREIHYTVPHALAGYVRRPCEFLRNPALRWPLDGARGSAAYRRRPRIRNACRHRAG